ncbi:MAG: NAD(P)H-dependent oxidoreductase [Bacteroidales bacterium]|nr:NAD(P)H-dependent oxidoreductase [Bacteroidales bacterium]
MKRILLIIAVVGMFCVSACGQKQNNKENKQMKTLVTYFSASGVTKQVAKQLSEVANADLQEITPESIYTQEDLDWTNKQSRSSVEMKDRAYRPAIKKDLANMESYSTIYVGFPIWWYTAPTIINTFFESYDFNGKTVVLFATSGGSNITKAVEDLQKTYPDINIKGGKLLNNPTKQQLEEFVTSYR